MPPLKLIAILFFVASVILGGIALKNAYDAYTEKTNTDTSRASHVITEAGGYEYIYTVDQKIVTELKAAAWSYTLCCMAAFAVGAILWVRSGPGSQGSGPLA